MPTPSNHSRTRSLQGTPTPEALLALKTEKVDEALAHLLAAKKIKHVEGGSITYRIADSRLAVCVHREVGLGVGGREQAEEIRRNWQSDPLSRLFFCCCRMSLTNRCFRQTRNTRWGRSAKLLYSRPVLVPSSLS